MDNIAALYYTDYFGLGLEVGRARGRVARPDAPVRPDARRRHQRPCGGRWGSKGRVNWLFVALFVEGLALMLFSRMTTLALAMPAMLAVRPLHEDVGRGDVRRRPVRQQEGARLGRRDRRRRRQRRGGRGGLPVPGRDPLADRPADPRRDRDRGLVPGASPSASRPSTRPRPPSAERRRAPARASPACPSRLRGHAGSTRA